MPQDNKSVSPPAVEDEEDIDLSGLIEKVIELQDLLLQSQEKNLVLSAQARELDQVARDAEDMKVELSAQSLLLADKSRENKQLHREKLNATDWQ